MSSLERFAREDKGSKDDKDPNVRCATEAQWMLTVLDDLNLKLNLTTFLTPDVLKDQIVTTLDADMVVRLREHFHFEKHFEVDLELVKSGDGNENSAEQLNSNSEVLKDSTRMITRLLKMSPALMRRLRELTQPKRSEAAHYFLMAFQNYKKLMQVKLRMTADEERAVKDHLDQLQQQEKHDHARFVALHDKLALDRSEHREILLQKDIKIQELQSQISQLKSETKLTRAMREKREKDEMENSTRTFERDEKKLKADITKLEQQLESNLGVQFDEEMKQQRLKAARKKDIDFKIAQYDADMDEKHKKQLEQSLDFAKESRELKKLMVYFDMRDEETMRQEMELKKIIESRTRELRVEKRNTEDQMLIQEIYAGFVKMKAKADTAANAQKKK